jgi:hypothetical protein
VGVVFPRLGALAPRISIEPALLDEAAFLRARLAVLDAWPEILVVDVEPSVRDISAAAALAAREARAEVRIIGGPRGLSHLASGAWDRGHLADVQDTLWAPLRAALKDAERALLLALGGYRAVAFRADDRPLVATAEGALRRVLTAERNVLDLWQAGGDSPAP